jgi:hypothetical protein
MPHPGNAFLKINSIVSMCYAPAVHSSSVGDYGITLVGQME